jgi:hypothetical protein
MNNECRPQFEPNIYDNPGCSGGHNHCNNLEQVCNRVFPFWLAVALHSDSNCKLWFQGEHSDAWGPSQLAVHVLAYLLGDLGINPDTHAFEGL